MPAQQRAPTRAAPAPEPSPRRPLSNTDNVIHQDVDLDAFQRTFSELWADVVDGFTMPTEYAEHPQLPHSISERFGNGGLSPVWMSGWLDNGRLDWLPLDYDVKLGVRLFVAGLVPVHEGDAAVSAMRGDKRSTQASESRSGTVAAGVEDKGSVEAGASSTRAEGAEQTGGATWSMPLPSALRAGTLSAELTVEARQSAAVQLANLATAAGSPATVLHTARVVRPQRASDTVDPAGRIALGAIRGLW